MHVIKKATALLALLLALAAFACGALADVVINLPDLATFSDGWLTVIDSTELGDYLYDNVKGDSTAFDAIMPEYAQLLIDAGVATQTLDSTAFTGCRHIALDIDALPGTAFDVSPKRVGQSGEADLTLEYNKVTFSPGKKFSFSSWDLKYATVYRAPGLTFVDNGARTSYIPSYATVMSKPAATLKPTATPKPAGASAVETLTVPSFLDNDASGEFRVYKATEWGTSYQYVYEADGPDHWDAFYHYCDVLEDAGFVFKETYDYKGPLTDYYYMYYDLPGAGVDEMDDYIHNKSGMLWVIKGTEHDLSSDTSISIKFAKPLTMGGQEAGMDLSPDDDRTKVPCVICGSSGKCQTCGGVGFIFTTSALGATKECSSCGTTGNCRNCWGKGWL